MDNIKLDAGSLTGKLLIANPYCSFGDVFDKAVIYIVAHSENGAFGLIINKQVTKLSLKKLFRLNDANVPDKEEYLYVGGPMEPERSFVLHSNEYSKNLLFRASGEIGVSSNMEIVRDILKGDGPKNLNVFLGYTGWSTEQLEKEIENNYWLILEADRSLVFEEESNFKWHAALEKLGVEHCHFSSQMGHS